MSTEQGYESRRFVAMATDPVFFRQQLPTIIGELVAFEPLQTPENQARAAMEQMHANARIIWNEGSNRLLMAIYGDYSRKNGLKVVRDTDFGKIKSVKSFEELTPDEARAWNTYLGLVDLPRNTAMTAIELNLSGNLFPHALPSVKYIADPATHYLFYKMRQASYQFINDIFPDLSDQEAKRLFGQLTTADIVRQKAEEEIVDFPAPILPEITREPLLPPISWPTQLAGFIKRAKEGETIVVPSDAMKQLAERALERLRPGEKIKVVVEKTQ